MRFCFLFFFFSIIFILVSIEETALFAQEIYPGKTIFIQPTLRTAYILPLKKESDCGGNLQLGIDVSGVLSRVNFGIAGGYSFYRGVDESIENFFNIEMYGGYTFHFFNLIGINPNIGFSLLSSVNSDNHAIIPSIRPGLDFNIHLFNRNYLVLGTSVEIPFSAGLSPGVLIQMGIRRSIPLMINVPPVSLKLSFNSDLFSPDNDGENDRMIINLMVKNKRSVKKWNISIIDDRGDVIRHWTGTALPPERIEWNGISSVGEIISSASDYKVMVQIVDKLNNNIAEQKFFFSDILVEEIDTGYKIRIPSIIFPPGSADVNLLTSEENLKNQIIIEKIAEKLLKFPLYNIRIEGHGNIENWNSEVLAAREQRETLIPLTEARALVIKDALISLGLKENRISVRGLGGSFPVAPFGDEINRWKNRRVEFILLK